MIEASRVMMLGVCLACLPGFASTANALAGLGYGGSNAGSHGSIGGATHGSGSPGIGTGGGTSAGGGSGGSSGGGAASGSASNNGSLANYGLGAGANYGQVPARAYTSSVGSGYGPASVQTDGGHGAATTTAQPRAASRQDGAPSQFGVAGTVTGTQAQAAHGSVSNAPANQGLGAGAAYGQPAAFRGGLLSAIAN